MNEPVELLGLAAASRALIEVLDEATGNGTAEHNLGQAQGVDRQIDELIDRIERSDLSDGVPRDTHGEPTRARRIAGAIEPILATWRQRIVQGANTLGGQHFPDAARVNVLALTLVIRGAEIAEALGTQLRMPDPYADYLFDFARAGLTDADRLDLGITEAELGYQFGVPVLDQLLTFSGRGPSASDVSVHGRAS